MNPDIHTIALVGDTKSGKSTLLGQILLSLNAVSPEKIKAAQQIAQNNNTPESFLPLLTENSKAAQKAGRTIHPNYHPAFLKRKQITFIDCSGHPYEITKSIPAESQADTVLLVVSAIQEEFDRSIQDDGLTRTFTFLAKTLGVKQIIVCVNKMDNFSVNWDASAFDHVVSEMKRVLRTAGFNVESSVKFVPISASLRENILQPSKKMKWAKKRGTLFKLIEQLPPPVNTPNKPFRFPIATVKKTPNGKLLVRGQIEFGTIQVSSNVVIAPLQQKAQISSILFHNNPVKFASAGMNVQLILEGVSQTNLYPGYVLCSPDSYAEPVFPEGQLTCQIIIFKQNVEMTKGNKYLFLTHTSAVSVQIQNLDKQMDPKTGQVIGTNVSKLSSAQVGIITLQPDYPVVVEKFKSFPKLGRIVLMEQGEVVAVGVILNTNSGINIVPTGPPPFYREQIEHSIISSSSSNSESQQGKTSLESAQENIKKLSQLFFITSRVRLDDVAIIIKMERADLMEFLIEMRDQFTGDQFKIEGDDLVIVSSKLDGFIEDLNSQFATWGNNEQNKIGKI
jgi:elongation factor 1-alpha